MKGILPTDDEVMRSMTRVDLDMSIPEEGEDETFAYAEAATNEVAATTETEEEPEEVDSLDMSAELTEDEVNATVVESHQPSVTLPRQPTEEPDLIVIEQDDDNSEESVLEAVQPVVESREESSTLKNGGNSVPERQQFECENTAHYIGIRPFMIFFAIRALK